MSIPINHHYVSRCQSDNFFNQAQGKIFVLNKESGRISKKQTTKTLFSENDSNARSNDDLSTDRVLLEKDLKDNFEDHFDRHLKIVKDLIKNPSIPSKTYKDSLIALTKFGVIGEVRNPASKKESDNTIADVLFGQILPHAAPELESELLGLKDRLSKTKYSNSLIYSDFAENIFQRMGEICSVIYFIDCNKFFLLPDVSAIRARAKINEYFNPDIREIAMVGIPLTSKIYLHSQSIKLEKVADSVASINESFPGEIERINFGLYDNSYEQVACENYDYLLKFRDNLDAIRDLSHSSQ